MQFFSRFSYIWKFPAEQERDYTNFIQPTNLTSLRLVSFITLFGMTLFLIIDFFRNVEYSIVLGTRLVILSVALAVMAYSYGKSVTSLGIRWSVILLTLLNFGIAIITASFARMPSFYITNLLFLIFVLVVTATGLHLRHALMLNVACFLIFIVYSQWIRIDPFYVSQYPHLISIFLYIHIVGFVLESRRRLNFLQFSELTKQKKLVEDLSNQKSKIISILSHDIASPVHSLLGIISLEKKGQISADEIGPLMQNVGEELSRVHTLMFSLMRWSKSQIEGFNVSTSLFGVHDLILENINFLQNRIDTKMLRIQLSPNTELWVRADLEMIRLVVRNLLSNAVKFAPVSSAIQIEVSVNEPNVQIDIANEGAAISSEVQEQLFGFQIKSLPGTLNEKGSGLGLALAKYFTELNGGLLFLLPYSKTKVTTFRLILPLAPMLKEEATTVKRETEV